MSLELKETIQALGKAFDAFKAENDARLKEIEKKGAADPLLAEKVDKINADIAQISALKKQLDTLETAVAQGQFPGGGKNELDRVKAQHKDAFAKFFRKGAEGGLRDLEVQAGLSTLSDPDGGFLVPEDYEQAIDRVALSVSAMRRLATVRTIGTDTYKKLVNQGGASAGWVGEKGARAETNTPTLTEIAINTKEIYAMPAATQTLLDDSRVDIAGWLADEVSIEFSEQESEAFINGNGVEQPKGIAAYAMAANSSYVWGKVGYITSGNTSLVNDLDKLIDLQHALKPVYRNGAAWLMNDATLATIRKMKDGDGNYIWVPGLKDGAPDTLLGKPVEIDDNVDDIAANKYPIFFANFKRAYLIIDRQGVRVLRDPYTTKPYVLFYTTKRVGGGIVMYEAIKALKVSA
ncbi:MAG TPA: phage major capsid protein [Deltaproteobacteria bacterium]|nr:phage major capsid protein [Deltaproteobacteria bacterium]